MPINSFLYPGAKSPTPGYEVANSGRFNRADNAFLSKTFSGAGTRTKYTVSAWVKRSGLGTTQTIFSAGTGANNYMAINFNGADNRLYWQSYSNDGANYDYFLYTTRRFRDPTAWLHVVCAFDSTQGTSSNRQKIYINGVQETVFTTETYSGSYSDYAFNSILHRIGEETASTGRQFDGYITEVCAIDGSQLAPTDFGEFDEDSPTIWKPKDVSGLTFGTNGFYLDFENSSELGTDVSGNSNTFTENNLDATDQATDTCTNNFATLNPLYYSSSQSTLSDGNLTATSSGANWNNFHSTIAPSAGKWYWEVKVVNVGSNTHPIGIIGTDDSELNKTSLGDAFDNGTTGISYVQTGDKDVAGSRTSYGDSYTTNDIIGVAMDLDNHKLYFSKNGTFQNSGDPTSGSTGTGAISIVSGHSYLASFAHYNTMVDSINFGSPSFSISSGNADGNGYGNFEYSVPSNYYSLCSKNLAEYGG
jgi:hypothetical protein